MRFLVEFGDGRRFKRREFRPQGNRYRDQCNHRTGTAEPFAAADAFREVRCKFDIRQLSLDLRARELQAPQETSAASAFPAPRATARTVTLDDGATDGTVFDGLVRFSLVLDGVRKCSRLIQFRPFDNPAPSGKCQNRIRNQS